MGIIGYFKAEPTEYVRITERGKVKREGNGIVGVYFPYKTSIEMVDITSHDQPFAFKETSRDSQEVNMQGGFVYRITDPGKVLAKYNFSIEPRTKVYLSEGDEKLKGHLLQWIHGSSRKIVQRTPLENLLTMNEELAASVIGGIKDETFIAELGVGLEMIYFSSIRPNPEIAKALETPFRETLQQKADEAIYSRRALAVERERAIKQNEMATQTELEQRRSRLVELESSNMLQEAESRAQAARKEMEVYQNMEPATLTAHALYQLGKNASRIGNLTITTELLAGLMNPK